MENIELAVITNIIDASDRTFGFAKLASTGEQAYVGPNIFRQKSLELGATIYCDIAQTTAATLIVGATSALSLFTMKMGHSHTCCRKP